MSLTLYYAPGTCALASHIALEDAGADYALHKLDFKTGEQRSPEYLKINPKERAPALVTDEGVLTESPVILGYIAQTYKDAKLAPVDSSYGFGAMQAFNMWIASTLHPAFAHSFRPERYADGAEHQAAVKKKAPAAIDECFELAERSLFRGPWATGEAYTVADPYLYVMTSWRERIEGLKPLSTYPKIADHYGRMRARPSVRKARAAQGLTD